MAEISHLISLLPSQPVQGVQQSQVAQGNTSQGAALIANLPPGTILSGFIINRDPSGNPILRTDNGGDVAFSTGFFLKIGSEVVIRIENSAGNSLAHILSVDGQPPEVAQTLSAFSQEPDVIVGQNPASSQLATQLNTAPPVTTPVLPPTEPAITVTGTLISTPPSDTSQTPALPTGTQLTMKIVTLNIATPATPAEPATAVATQPVSPQASTVSYAAYARVAATIQPATPSSITIPIAISETTTLPASATLGTTPSQTVAAAQPPPTVTPATPQTPTNTVTITASAPVNPAPATSSPLPASPATGITQPAAGAIQNIPPVTSLLSPQPQSHADVISTSSATSVTTTPASPVPAITTASVTKNDSISAPSSTPVPTTPPAPIPLTTTASPTATLRPAVSASTTPLTTIQAGQTVVATVIGKEPTGEALVQTPAGVIRLQPGTVVPSGSTITFEIVQTTLPDIAAAETATSPPAPLTELAQQWTSLQQIFNLLAGRTVSTGLEPPSLTLPGIVSAAINAPSAAATPQTLSVGLLLFIAALRSRDFASWLGRDNVNWLEDMGHGNLIRKAASEFSGLSHQFTEAPPQHWQPLFFPVAVDGTLQQVRIFTKRDRKQGGTPQAKGKEDTRFVIEVDLTQLGELQMDGFVRRNDKDVQFDMMIRSLSPLSSEIQQDILKIYNDTGALTGYRGSLAFQTVKEFPVNPMEDLVTAMGAVVA